MDSGDLLVSVSRARLKTSVLLQADQRDDGSLDAAGAVKALGRSLTALSAPESATEWLMDEAEAARLAASLGTGNCMRLAAMWDGGIDAEALRLSVEERVDLEAVADNEGAGEEARGEARGRLAIQAVLDAQEKRIRQSVGGGHQIDRAFMVRQEKIAERAAELANAGVFYTGAAIVPLTLSEDVGGIETPAMPVAHVPSGSAPAIIERESTDIGGRIAGIADRDGISLLEAASRYCAEHNLAAGWAVHLTVAGECARVSMMAATAPPAASSGTSDGAIESGVADAATEKEKRAIWVAETAAKIAHEVTGGRPSIDCEEVEEEEIGEEVAEREAEEASPEGPALDPIEALYAAMDRAGEVWAGMARKDEEEAAAERKVLDEARLEEEGKAEEAERETRKERIAAAMAASIAGALQRTDNLEEEAFSALSAMKGRDVVDKALAAKEERRARKERIAAAMAASIAGMKDQDESPFGEQAPENPTPSWSESWDDELADLTPEPNTHHEIEEDRHLDAPEPASPQEAPPAPVPPREAPPVPAPPAPRAPAPRYYLPEPPEPGRGMHM